VKKAYYVGKIREKILLKMSLNNVHEPRNAEITAFLGLFLVE